MTRKTFRRWEIDQARLFPPSVRDFVPEGHLARLVSELVRDELDLSAVYAKYTELRGYCSEDNLALLEERGIRGYVATGRQKHGTSSATSGDTAGKGPLTEAMRRRLRLGGHRSRYRLRKHVVEPVFGQIKEACSMRKFLHRGLGKVASEWAMLCTAHNLLKLLAARVRLAR